MTKHIIIDIDGTICDSSHRHPHEYKKVKDDKLINQFIINLFEILKGSHNFCFVTAREESSRFVTKQWLKNTAGLSEDRYTLYMRPTGDKRTDKEIKKEIYHQYLSLYDIVQVFEDDYECAKMYKSLGLNIYDIDLITQGQYAYS